MGIDFNALREKARRIDESEKGQRERQADSRRAVEEAARERHGFDGSAMWQLADDMEARQQAGWVSSAVKTAQGVASAAAPGLSRLGRLAEEISSGRQAGVSAARARGLSAAGNSGLDSGT